MQTPAPFFVDETATFHIAVCRLLIRFFSNRCAENTIMHSIKYPFHFHLFSEISYFSRQHSAAFFDTTTFHVYADSNQILSFWHGPTQFPSPISLSTPSLHFRVRQACAPVTVFLFEQTRPVALLSALLSIYPTCLLNTVSFFSAGLAWIVLHSWLRFSEPCSSQCVWSWFFLEYIRETRWWVQRVLEKWTGFLRNFRNSRLV